VEGTGRKGLGIGRGRKGREEREWGRERWEVV